MSALWRYTAVPVSGGTLQSGELAAATAAEVRASLRRIGLRVVRLQQKRHRKVALSEGAWSRLVKPLQLAWEQYRRGRSRGQRAEFYDSLATMLGAGLPLTEALDTLASSKSQGASGQETLAQLRAELRDGASLGDAMSGCQGVAFGPGEVAMIRAAEHGGTLPEVLSRLALQHEKRHELSSRLVSALTYPAVIALVGVGVAIFLSLRTLPQLTQLLIDADVEVPRLTSMVMALGQGVARHGLVIAVAVMFMAVTGVIVRGALQRRFESCRPRWLRGIPIPGRGVYRELSLSRLAIQLAELLNAGVPLVEALRVAAPTAPRSLANRLRLASDALERGDDLGMALRDDQWFDAEFRRLIEIGASSGELDQMLQRLGERLERRARHSIDRLASILEPAVILALAAMVGTVAMAAILPLVRLQEILR